MSRLDQDISKYAHTSTGPPYDNKVLTLVFGKGVKRRKAQSLSKQLCVRYREHSIIMCAVKTKLLQGKQLSALAKKSHSTNMHTIPTIVHDTLVHWYTIMTALFSPQLYLSTLLAIQSYEL